MRYALVAAVVALAALSAALLAIFRTTRRIRAGTLIDGMIEEVGERDFAPTSKLTATYNGFVSYVVTLKDARIARITISSYIPRSVGEHATVLFEPSPDRYSFRADLFIPASLFLLAAVAAALSSILFLAGPFVSP